MLSLSYYVCLRDLGALQEGPHQIQPSDLECHGLQNSEPHEPFFLINYSVCGIQL
jgi:hypothetical protein